MIETQLARCSRGALCYSMHRPLKNLMFYTVSSFVLRGPDTCTYSQDFIAKRKALRNILHKALSKGEIAIL